MILSQVFGSDYAWVVGRCKRVCDWGCARSVWKTDLHVPPTWVLGGDANRFLGRYMERGSPNRHGLRIRQLVGGETSLDSYG